MTVAPSNSATFDKADAVSAVVPADALIHAVEKQVYAANREYQRFNSMVTADGLRNFIFASDDHPVSVERAFTQLRWGGQFIYAARSKSRLKQVARLCEQNGFLVDTPDAEVRIARKFIPFLSRKLPYLAARKIALIRPGDFTDRFTFHVELEKYRVDHADQFVVHKQVPTVEQLSARLQNKWPDAARDVVEKRARKFCEKIFPTFLTREAAILMILQEHLPSRYASHVPHVIHVEKDSRGFVTSLRMNWLRNGGQPLSHLEFALQAADLLRAIHDSAGVIHLDLRLDNMVITENGVGFVDFGSAVRANEDLSKNPLLNTLFDELMRTSHIQKMLFSMTQSGQVTARHIADQHGKVDKAIDLFYLALQFNTPHNNPDLAGLIQYDPHSEMSGKIHALSQSVLKPADPQDTSYRNAKDILRALEMLESDLHRKARKIG